MRTIVIATNNKNKLAEFRKIFSSVDGFDYEILSLADIGFNFDIEESADSFEGNAYIKARTVAAFSGYTAVADDSGLVVDALGGAPGVYSARYAGEGASSEQLMQKLLTEMASVPEGKRNAKFVSVMCAVFPSGKRVFSKGSCSGQILFVPAGKNGFGYDPLFYYPPCCKTFAQLNVDEKNKISHRALAAEMLFREFEKLSDVEFTPLLCKE